MFNPNEDFDSNAEEMSGCLDLVKTAQVTFAIKDTSIDGVEVKKDEFIGITGKSILCSNVDKIVTTTTTIEKMIDEFTSVVTILVGDGVEQSEVEAIVKPLQEKYSDIEFDVKEGNQPVYSFIIGIE